VSVLTAMCIRALAWMVLQQAAEVFACLQDPYRAEAIG
jgi:hypothetical protein